MRLFHLPFCHFILQSFLFLCVCVHTDVSRAWNLLRCRFGLSKNKRFKPRMLLKPYNTWERSVWPDHYEHFEKKTRLEVVSCLQMDTHVTAECILRHCTICCVIVVNPYPKSQKQKTWVSNFDVKEIDKSLLKLCTMAGWLAGACVCVCVCARATEWKMAKTMTCQPNSNIKTKREREKLRRLQRDKRTR